MYTSRRTYTIEPTSRLCMELSEALRYVRKHTVFLCYRYDGQVDLWSCDRKLPMPLKRSVFKHRKQLARMMREAHPKVCPARDLHAFEWVYYPTLDRHVCLLCAEIGA